MTTFRIGDDELEALQRSELSHAAKVLYLTALRPYMDFSTRIVGKVRRISYQGLHEVIEYIPPQGSKRPKGDYSVKAIRCLIDELERAGLVRRLPNDHKALFLECLLAHREDAPKNMKGRGRAEKKGRGRADLNASSEAGLTGYTQAMTGRHDVQMRGTPPVSGKPISLINAAASQCAVDNLSCVSGVLLPDEIVDWLRAAEKRRGKIMTITAADDAVKSWVYRGVTVDEIASAYELAVADRSKTANAAALNPNFLDIFIGRVLSKRIPWNESWEGIVSMGLRRGIQQGPNERPHEFKARVFAAVDFDGEDEPCQA